MLENLWWFLLELARRDLTNTERFWMTLLTLPMVMFGMLATLILAASEGSVWWLILFFVMIYPLALGIGILLRKGAR